MQIRKKEIKYISVIIILLIIAITARVDLLQKNSQPASSPANQQQYTQSENPIDCDNSSDTLSALINQPESENSCLNIGCGSFF